MTSGPAEEPSDFLLCDRKGESAARLFRHTLQELADGGEARSAGQFVHFIVGVIEQMPIFGEALLGDRRHVLPKLVAQCEQPARSQVTVDLRDLGGWLVPEVQDVIGHDDVGWRYLGKGGNAALDERQ